MNRTELRDRLRDLGVPDGMYELTGMQSGSRSDLSFPFLEERSGEWVVGVEERGRRGVVRRFSTEDEACRFLYDRLAREVTAPPAARQSPQEEERGRQITEELVRRLKDRSRRGGAGDAGPGDAAT
ncbi:MAG TPA: hypothetical protein VF069_19005 [Streptosporangiaceae bacterium]